MNEIAQPALPGLDGKLHNIINVASVPQRSPFRYPGGKTWLVPYIRKWLASLGPRPNEFVEPFAGGGIVSLTVAFEQLARHVTMAELDDDVAAVWQTVLGQHGVWLAQRIIDFDLTPENVEEILAKPARSVRDRAFQTIVMNRVNRGGILAPGAGRIKNGENGKGMRSRWYPQTLQRRILDITKIRERVTFESGDGLKVLQRFLRRRDTAVFLDPPYTAGGKRAGSRLYFHSTIDHEALFDLAGKLCGDFLMTYDDAPEVRSLALQHRFDVQTIPMKSTHHAVMMELLIGRNLDWARR
jgi:DNA adenine methylase